MCGGQPESDVLTTARIALLLEHFCTQWREHYAELLEVQWAIWKQQVPHHGHAAIYATLMLSACCFARLTRTLSST